MLAAYLALAVFPLIIYSSGIGGMERGEQVSIPQRQRNNVFSLFFFWQSIFWTLSSITLYPSCVHLVKGGEVCLNDSDFLPDIHFPQSGNFISKRKLNLLAILNYVYPLPPPKNPKTSRD